MTEPREPGRWLPEPGKVVSTALHEQGAQFPNIGAMRVLEALREAGWSLVRRPAPNEVVEATEDEHGVRQWWITGGVVAAFDSGTFDFDIGHYHGDDPRRLIEAAAALLAAAAGSPYDQ